LAEFDLARRIVKSSALLDVEKLQRMTLGHDLPSA